jgi:hypothetical protein
VSSGLNNKWLKFIQVNKIQRIKILIGSIYWGLRVRYSIGGWKALFQPINFNYWQALL